MEEYLSAWLLVEYIFRNPDLQRLGCKDSLWKKIQKNCVLNHSILLTLLKTSWHILIILAQINQVRPVLDRQIIPSQQTLAVAMDKVIVKP